MHNIMLDWETMGNKPGCVVVSLGACHFGEGRILSEFYTRIDLQSCVDLGLKIDPSTLLWWLKQSDAARAELLKDGSYPLPKALLKFNSWVESVGLSAEIVVWGNGSDFDLSIAREVYDVCHLPMPWKFWNHRCYRTVKNLFPGVPMERSGTHHNAVDDAKSQALHLMKMLPQL